MTLEFPPIKNIKEEKCSKCNFPNCKTDAKFIWKFDVKNESTAEEQVYVELPFCTYHFHIVCGGNFHCVSIEGEEKTFSLVGPFNEIQLIEQVMAAREVVATKKSN